MVAVLVDWVFPNVFDPPALALASTVTSTPLPKISNPVLIDKLLLNDQLTPSVFDVPTEIVFVTDLVLVNLMVGRAFVGPLAHDAPVTTPTISSPSITASLTLSNISIFVALADSL